MSRGTPLQYKSRRTGGGGASKISKNAHSLMALSQVSNDVAGMMISRGSKELILSLVEIVSNIIKGNVSLTQSQFDSLKRYRTQLRELVLKKTSLSKRKQILQHGGFLPLLTRLISPIVTALGGLFAPQTQSRRY